MQGPEDRWGRTAGHQHWSCRPPGELSGSIVRVKPGRHRRIGDATTSTATARSRTAADHDRDRRRPTVLRLPGWAVEANWRSRRCQAGASHAVRPVVAYPNIATGPAFETAALARDYGVSTGRPRRT